MKMPSPKTRKYIYDVITAGSAVVALYGVASPENIPVWLFLAATVLGVSGSTLARTNVPDDEK